MSAPDARWWIEADGRVWGPYPAARLAMFRDEGRLGAASLTAREAAGPFVPAALQPALAGLFEATPTLQPEAATPGLRALLVVADVEDGALPAFEAALGGHGEVVRVGRGLWLLRAREGPTALRNALSRRLRGLATLLVVEVPLGSAAWFNLDGATDRALRKLWADSSSSAHPRGSGDPV